MVKNLLFNARSMFKNLAFQNSFAISLFRLFGTAFLTCLGMTFIILACAVPNPKIFYPFFVFLFYALTFLPILIAHRSNADNGTTPCLEFAYFLTAGLVLSAFALPVVLARSAVVSIVILYPNF